MSRNYHKEAINVLRTVGRDRYEEILLKVAETQPSAVVFAYCGKPARKWSAKKEWPDHLQPYTPSKEVLSLINDRFIDAVKRVRSETGYGLKEAKDIADYLRVNA